MQRWGGENYLEVALLSRWTTTVLWWQEVFPTTERKDQRDVTVFIFFLVYLLFFGSLFFYPSVLWLSVFILFCSGCGGASGSSRCWWRWQTGESWGWAGNRWQLLWWWFCSCSSSLFCVPPSVCLCFCFFFRFSRCRCYYRRLGGRWQLAVALVVVAGGHGGERNREENVGWNRKCLVFWLTLGQIFSTPGAWRSNIFIGSGRGTFCLFWCKISALGLTRKHPNHWLKVAMMNCRFCRKNSWPGWPLWGDATASTASINPNSLH